MNIHATTNNTSIFVKVEEVKQGPTHTTFCPTFHDSLQLIDHLNTIHFNVARLTHDYVGTLNIEYIMTKILVC